MKIFYDTEFIEGRQQRRLFGFKVGYTKPTIDLISIGMVAEDGRELYAVSREFNLWEAWNRYDVDKHHTRNYKPKKVYWIRENVLLPIFKDFNKRYVMHRFDDEDRYYDENFEYSEYSLDFTYSNMKFLLQQYGSTREEIAMEVEHFVNYTLIGKQNEGPVELYAYYGAYDHVVLMWLWGKMLNKPKGFPMFSHDLKQMIDEYVESINSLVKSTDLHSEKTYLKGFEFPFLLPDRVDNLLKCVKKHPDYPKQENEHNALDDAKWNKALYDFLTNKI